MANRQEPGIPKVAVWVLFLFVLGTPLVAWLWETLNHLLSGRFEPLQLLLAVPTIALFWLLLRLTGRLVTSWAQPADARTSQPTREAKP